MSFTDRFITIPIIILSEADENLIGKSDEYEAIMKLNPMEITNYYNSFYGDEPDKECVNITFKNGHKVLAYLTVKEFEKLLNSHNT